MASATYLLLASSSIALLWRRSRPLIVLMVTLTASLVWDVIGLAGGTSLAIFISLYGVGRYIEEDRTSLLAVGVALILVVADDLIEGEPATVFGLSLVLVFLGWYVGRRIKSRGEYVALLEERAGYLEREWAAAAQQAVDKERTRIARELHDLVAHRVSMITVQAGAAQTVAASDPQRAIRAMEAVEEEGREALRKLRQVLGVLRPDEERKGLAPMHGLADIPGLVDEMNGVVIGVSLSNAGVPDILPAWRSCVIPNRPGGPNQRAQTRRTRPKSRSSALQRRPHAHHRGDRSRVRCFDAACIWPRIGGNAGAGNPARRHLRSGPRSPWLISDHGSPSPRTESVMSIRVLVIDDQALVRDGFAMVLDHEDDIEVVGEEGTGVEAVEAARSHRPDVVLMDIRMPEMDGLEATRLIVAEAEWPVKVLILTTFDPDEYVY